MENGLEEKYVIKDSRKLRYGYTTGSCAAAAAQAAACMLLGEGPVEEIRLTTPKGFVLRLAIEEAEKKGGKVRCGVRKDAGDDPDVTDGIMVYALAEKKKEPGITIDGGIGVGRVTRPGLDQPVGGAAINHVPREMIEQGVRKVMEEKEYDGGIRITIEIPRGAELAEKTFNPRLGIVGGISVLGTSGIVEPMSESALKESIRTELRQKILEGREYLPVSPGNYGREFIREHLDVDLEQAVKCSNYVGDTIAMAKELGAKGILFVAHIGKFIKVSGGMMNTHSRYGDARMELLSAHGIRAGVPAEILRRLLDAVTTEEALAILKENGFLEPVMREMMKRISLYFSRQSEYDTVKRDAMEIGAIVFSGTQGELGRTENADGLLEKIREADAGSTGT